MVKKQPPHQSPHNLPQATYPPWRKATADSVVFYFVRLEEPIALIEAITGRSLTGCFLLGHSDLFRVASRSFIS